MIDLHRKSIRMSGYDYSQSGWYYVTICAHNKVSIWGHIKNSQMILSEKGKIVESTWQGISMKYKQVELDTYVIMPNHLHGIIIIKNKNVVGAGFSRPSLPTTPILGQIIGYFKYKSTKEINNIYHGADVLNEGQKTRPLQKCYNFQKYGNETIMNT